MRFRIARFLTLIVMLNGLLVSSALGVGRQQPLVYGSPYVCLIYDGDGRTNGQILDLRTGLYHQDRRTHSPLVPIYTPGDLSPDHRYRAYLEWNNRPDGTSTLFIYPAEGGQIVVQDDVTSPFFFFWSPDGHQFAYTSATTLDVTLTIASADGSNQRRVKIPTAGALDTYAMGWSPDGRSLLINTRQPDGRRWELWDAQTLTVKALTTWDWVDTVYWSPDGHYLFYLSSRTGTPNNTLNVVTIDPLTQRGHILAGTASLYDLQWASDSRYLRATYATTSPPLSWHLDVFSVDGHEQRVLADADVPDTISTDHIAQWMQTTPRLVFFRRVGGLRGQLTLNTFDADQATVTTTVADLAKGLFASPSQPERVALVERAGQQIRGVLMNLDGSQRTTIFQTGGTDDYGDPAWSADGRYVAITWSTELGAERDVHLSWLKADGTGLLDVHGYIDVKGLHIAGDTAVFLAKQPTDRDFSLQQLDLRTGSLTRIGRPVHDALYVDTEDTTGDYRVWWRAPTGALGVDVYAMQPAAPRERHFRFGLPGVPIRNPPAFFVAPGGEVAATKFGDPMRHEYLQVSRADGSAPILITDDVVGLGDALWSPDSKLVAFTQAVYMGVQPNLYRHLTLEVYTASGQFVRSIDGLSIFYRNLAWTTCD